MRYIPILILLNFFSCSFPSSMKEREVLEIKDHCFLVNNSDTLTLGAKYFKENLFEGIGFELFPNIQKDEMEYQIDVYDKIDGVYLNSKIFDSFNLENDSITKIDNSFDVLFIYPEISRYNFQFSQTVNYRIFHYLGFLYREPSSSENLPYYVKNISKLNNNELLISYVDNSNYLIEKDRIDTLIFTTYPDLKIEFYNNGKADFQKSNKYYKLSEEVIEDIHFEVPFSILPQDLTELYVREIITHILNLKFNRKYKTNEIIGEWN